MTVQGPRLIERPRLVQAIEESNAHVVALVAPAGYGKTVLARQWAASRESEAFWYPASGHSADVAALANDLLTLLRVPREVATTARDALRARRPTTTTARVAASVLAKALEPWPPGAWLIIDDYHLVGADEACECFVETLVERSPVPLLLAARERPRWLTTRRRVYREVLEITTPTLAMTEDEVVAVLSHGPSEQTYTWSELAEGWPAVVGLAMHGGRAALPAGQMAQTVYDFLAAELYSELSVDLQRAAKLLAIPERLTPLVCRFLLGERYAETVATLQSAGFVSAGTDISIHPLLRHYLRHIGGEDADMASTTDRLIQFLIQARAYDDAFAAVDAHGQTAHLAELFDASFRDLLSVGRDASLERWISLARAAGVEAAIVDLVDAELAFRRGDLARADALAQRSASQESLSRARAYLVAARTAHMRSDEHGALDLLQRALSVPVDERDRPDLEWYQFILACELERADAPELLETYARSAAASFDQHVRLLNGKGVLASQFGGIGEVLLQPREILELARHTTEPVIRCGFMNRYAILLWAHGRYADALRVVDAELKFVRAARLDFATPHVSLLRAFSEVGLRRYKSSDATIRSIIARAPRDAYVGMAIAGLRARALCAQGRPDAAVDITSADWRHPPNRALYGEYLTTRALALASARRPAAALEALEQARETTRTAEMSTRADLVVPVISLERDGDVAAELARGTATAWSTGHLDAFVCTYRACPRLLAYLRPTDPNYIDAVNLIAQLGDERVARDGGLSLTDSRPSASLTRRENEVLQLLGDGLTNRQIATRLYISEVTAKVHVSRILAKLGVSSRTEAAIRAHEGRTHEADATATGERSG